LAELIYIDLFEQSRAIAEERAKKPGLAGVRFLTGYI